MTTTATDHSGEAGFIFRAPKTDAIVYLADEQGIDVGGQRYAIICTHGSVGGATSKRDAQFVARYPGNFCPACNG